MVGIGPSACAALPHCGIERRLPATYLGAADERFVVGFDGDR
jgi:hypothetical protein